MAESNELPLPGYDQLPLGSLAHRVRTLDREDVRTLVDYESQHADRPAVLELLHSRLEELRRGAEPSEGSPVGEQPEQAPPPDSTGDQAKPETAGPPINPPSQGVPTNPAQPRPTN